MERIVKEDILRCDLGFTSLTVKVAWLGSDCHLLLYGGETPHLGTTVLAVPRLSLTGEGTSATSSVLNVLGHKDDVLCRALAEQVCSALHVVTVCSGGVHLNNITKEQIALLQNTVEELAVKITR